MHGHTDISEFLADASGPLSLFYASLGLINAAAAWITRRAELRGTSGPVSRRWTPLARLCGSLAALFLVLAWIASHPDPAWLRWVSLPERVKGVLNLAAQPTWLTLGTFAALAVFYLGRRWLVEPRLAWLMLNASLLLLGLSLTDPDFVQIVGKPDNVPIVGMFYLTAFFTWYSTRRAVLNDDRAARGAPPLEAEDNDEVLVWPDLVYSELICMVALTALLIVWSLAIEAPLEEPANAAQTPNPSKAPWYFLGLQELLVYFDPWMAGVVLPALIVFGLCAIPYLDRNPAGVGYYTIAQRRFAWLVYHFGFVGLWLLLIAIGTFVRGPNWEAFGLYETWDAHRAAAVTNRDLSTWFWVQLLGGQRPAVPLDAGGWQRAAAIVWRELPGILVLAAWFGGLPLLLTTRSRSFRRLSQQLGRGRSGLLLALMLIMLLVPLKMLARWTLDLSVIVSLPELQLNL